MTPPLTRRQRQHHQAAAAHTASAAAWSVSAQIAEQYANNANPHLASALAALYHSARFRQHEEQSKALDHLAQALLPATWWERWSDRYWSWWEKAFNWSW